MLITAKLLNHAHLSKGFSNMRYLLNINKKLMFYSSCNKMKFFDPLHNHKINYIRNKTSLEYSLSPLLLYEFLMSRQHKKRVLMHNQDYNIDPTFKLMVYIFSLSLFFYI